MCKNFQKHHDIFIPTDDFPEEIAHNQFKIFYILLDFKVFFLSISSFMYTFPLCFYQKRWTDTLLFHRLLLSNDYYFNRLFLRVMLCPGVITISGVHCKSRTLLYGVSCSSVIPGPPTFAKIYLLYLCFVRKYSLERNGRHRSACVCINGPLLLIFVRILSIRLKILRHSLKTINSASSGFKVPTTEDG